MDLLPTRLANIFKTKLIKGNFANSTIPSRLRIFFSYRGRQFSIAFLLV